MLSDAFILFISKASKSGTQKYFEGEVLENNGGHLTVEVDSQYKVFAEKAGGFVNIDMGKVISKRDFPLA